MKTVYKYYRMKTVYKYYSTWMNARCSKTKLLEHRGKKLHGTSYDYSMMIKYWERVESPGL